MNLQTLALAIVANAHGMMPSELYVVWFAKTLRNWKALVSTDIMSGHYWEVTHNGETGNTYIDWYTKKKNTVVSEVMATEAIIKFQNLDLFRP